MSAPTKPDLQRGTSALVIAQNIRTAIEGGRLRHGEQLPSTRALADEWHTSVATITRAMAQLADEGFVINRNRSSRLVNNPTQQQTRPGRPARPQLVLIGGYAGSGKTELGRVLVRSTGWAMLDKDTATRPVVEHDLQTLGQSPHDRESAIYLREVRPLEYEGLMAQMRENVELGASVIVTAPFIREFSDEAWCTRTAATAASMNADIHVVWVRCDVDTMHYYLRHRGAARDAAKLADWDTYVHGLDLAFTPKFEHHHIVNNSAGSEPLQKQAAELLTAVTA